MELTKEDNKLSGLRVILIFLGILSFLSIFLELLYSLPLKDTILLYVGIFTLFYIPGNLILKYSDAKKDEYFVNLFHSLALGAALMPLIYALARAVSYPGLAYWVEGIIILMWLGLFIKDFNKGNFNIYTTAHDIRSVLVLLALVLFLLHLTHFTDVVFLHGGFKIRNSFLTETIFHLGIINMLKGVFPPFYPYASGIKFSYYHLNMHLEIEIFGSDLSFIPGLLGMSPVDHLWTRFFRSTIWGLFCLNGQLPALFVTFICLLYLKRFYEEGSISSLLLFSILGFSAYGFKSSAGPHIMIAALLTGIASTVFIEDKKRGWLVSIASALTLVIMSLDLIIVRGSPTNQIFKFDLLNQYYSSLDKFGLSGTTGFLLVLLFPAYVLATFGVRSLGFYFFKDILKKVKVDAFVIFLLIFVLSGFIISEAIFIGSPKTEFGVVNNAGWFAVQSLTVAWLLLAFSLARLDLSRKRFFATAAITLLLSMPTTIQFLTYRYDNSYYTVDADAQEVVRYLEHTRPESIILHPPNFDGPSLASNLAGRQSVISFLQSYVLQTIGGKEAETRLEDVKSFFDSRGTAERVSICKKYGVNYVYAPVSLSSSLDREHFLSRILRNTKYVLYKTDC
jgi:hypothetical protein